jgi:uncharacterized protein (DUF433 family)
VKEKILAEFPELEREDIYEALGFAAEAMEERFIPLEEAVRK